MTYLIIHFLENQQDFDFDNPIEKAVREIALPEDLILTADNFSNVFTIQQYAKEIKACQELTVICDFANEQVEPGAGLSLLNALIRKENVRLLTNLIHPKIKPVFIRLKGKLVSDWSTVL